MIKRARIAFLFAYALRVVRSVGHLFVPNGRSPEWYRRAVRFAYEQLIYDPGTHTVKVISGPLKGMKKCGPFREGDFSFALGQYECETVEALYKYCRPGMTVFDIGANAGYLTLLMSKLVGEFGHVHAFEPIPQTFNSLLQTLQINGLRNVTVHQVAVSDHVGEARMTYVGILDGFATLADGGHNYYCGQSAESVFVSTTSLDILCKDRGDC
jgi:FkbM family methyltransferase